MYKIRCYFVLLTLLSIQLAYAQPLQVVPVRIAPLTVFVPKVPPPVRQAASSGSQNRPHRIGDPTPAHLINKVYKNRQTVFTAHLLADKVEPEKKYRYDVLVADRTVSLPYPTPFQTQNQYP